MIKTLVFLLLASAVVVAAGAAGSARAEGDVVFRRANFSNEFEITTPEGLNASGLGLVRSGSIEHTVRIGVNGLTPGANSW